MVQRLVQRSWSGGENSENDTDPQQYCHQGVPAAAAYRARNHTEAQRDISDQVILPPSHSEIVYGKQWTVN